MRDSRDFRDGADPVVRRAIDELRRLPSVPADAVAKVTTAAAAARMLPAADEPVFLERARSWGRIFAAAGLVAAAAIAGFVIRGTMTPPPSTRLAAATPIAPAAFSAERASEPIVEQFVFKAANARRVALIGDFNRWDASAKPMTRSPDGELWSVSVPMMPGRHVYAFLVNDSLLVLDPGAPKSRDPDLGADASVRMVGHP